MEYNTSNIILAWVFIIFTCVPTGAALYYFSSLLVKNGNAAVLNGLWHVFSFAFVISVVVIVFAIPLGAFTKSLGGPPHEGLGGWLWAVGEAFTDFAGDLKFLFAIFVIIIFPQAIAYVGCALNGCAGRVHFVDVCTNGVCWGIIKFFAGVGGYSLALLVTPFLFDGVGHETLGKFSRRAEVEEVPFIMLCMTISVLLAVTYKQGRVIFSGLAKVCPPGIKAVLKWLHMWATRNNRQADVKDDL
jgi:hypothetical protein